MSIHKPEQNEIAPPTVLLWRRLVLGVYLLFTTLLTLWLAISILAAHFRPGGQP